AEVGKIAEEARAAGALRCAPRQLAAADAHLTFLALELEEGDSFRARKELDQAAASAGEALRRTRGPRCQEAAAPAPATAVAPPPRLGFRDRDGDGVADPVDACPDE